MRKIIYLFLILVKPRKHHSLTSVSMLCLLQQPACCVQYFTSVLCLLWQLPAAPVSEVGVHMMRSKGASLIGEAILSLQAPGFLHSRDKLTLFTVRLTVSKHLNVTWLSRPFSGAYTVVVFWVKHHHMEKIWSIWVQADCQFKTKMYREHHTRKSQGCERWRLVGDFSFGFVTFGCSLEVN